MFQTKVREFGIFLPLYKDEKSRWKFGRQKMGISRLTNLGQGEEAEHKSHSKFNFLTLFSVGRK